MFNVLVHTTAILVGFTVGAGVTAYFITLRHRRQMKQAAAWNDLLMSDTGKFLAMKDEAGPVTPCNKVQPHVTVQAEHE